MPSPKPSAIWKDDCLILVLHPQLKSETFDLSCSLDPISWHIKLLTTTFLLNLLSWVLVVALKFSPNIQLFFNLLSVWFYSYYSSKICTQQHYYNFPLLRGYIWFMFSSQGRKEVNKMIAINTTAVFCILNSHHLWYIYQRIACKHTKALLGESGLFVSIMVKARSFGRTTDDKDRKGWEDLALCTLHQHPVDTWTWTVAWPLLASRDQVTQTTICYWWVEQPWALAGASGWCNPAHS